MRKYIEFIASIANVSAAVWNLGWGPTGTEGLIISGLVFINSLVILSQ